MKMNGHQLRALRHRLGLTQAAMAQALGRAPNTIARCERDEKPISPSLAAAADAAEMAAKAVKLDSSAAAATELRQSAHDCRELISSPRKFDTHCYY